MSDNGGLRHPVGVALVLIVLTGMFVATVVSALAGDWEWFTVFAFTWWILLRLMDMAETRRYHEEHTHDDPSS